VRRQGLEPRTRGLRVRSGPSILIYGRLYLQAAGQRRRTKTPLDAQKLQPELPPVIGASEAFVTRLMADAAASVAVLHTRYPHGLVLIGYFPLTVSFMPESIFLESYVHPDSGYCPPS
jgi:hypothetical protein